MSWRFTLKSGWRRSESVSFTTSVIRFLSWPWVAGLLAALSLGMHAALLPHLTSAIPSDLGDPLLNTWILWWNAHQLPFTDAYWNAPAFAPMARALGLSETLLGLTWLTTPLQWFGASPVLAYNVLFIALPVLNGLSAYWLCLVLTGRRDAATIGALAFAFAPYHADQLSHIQTEALFFMPIAAAALHQYWTASDRRWLVVLAGATALNALVCGYFLLFFSIFLGIAVVWLTLSSGDLKKSGAVLASLAIAMLSIAPVIVTFRSVRSQYGLARGQPEVEFYSADATSPMFASHRLAVWPLTADPNHPGKAAYPGLAIVLVVLAGAASASRGRIKPALMAESRPVVALLALAMTMVIAGATVIPRPQKVISIGLYLGLIAVLGSRQLRALVRSASTPALYVIGLVAAAALSVGPVGRAFGHRFWYKPPYLFLMRLPGFDAARVPSLFITIEVLCLAVLAAFAIARLWPAVTRASLVAVAAIAALIVIDGWSIVPVVTVPGPPPVALTADLVLELPAYGWVENVQAMYRGMAHGRPVVNGYSGYLPPQFERLQADLWKDCVLSLDTWRGGRSMDAVIWRQAGSAPTLDADLRKLWPGASREETPASIVYRQPRTSAPTDVRNLNRCK